VIFSKLLRIQAAVFDFAQVLAQAFEDVVALALGDLAFDFREREMDNVVVVDFRAGEMFA